MKGSLEPAHLANGVARQSHNSVRVTYANVVSCDPFEKTIPIEILQRVSAVEKSPNKTKNHPCLRIHIFFTRFQMHTLESTDGKRNCRPEIIEDLGKFFLRAAPNSCPHAHTACTQYEYIYFLHACVPSNSRVLWQHPDLIL